MSTQIILPKNPALKPYPFQLDILTTMLRYISRTTRIYNGLDLGLGKTAISYLLANSIDARNHLIIVPGSLLLKWEREYRLWSRYTKTSPRPHTIIDWKDARDFIKEQNKNKNKEQNKRRPLTLIISYNRLLVNAKTKEATKHLIDFVNNHDWDLLTCDEFHECKSVTAKRTNILRTLMPKFPKVQLLSATPIMNNPIDIFPALYEIIPHTKASTYQKKLCSNFIDYAEKFTFIKNTAYGKMFFGFRDKPLLKKIIRENDFFVRLKQETVLPELPPITYERLDLTDVPAIETTKDPELLAYYIRTLGKGSEEAEKLKHNKEYSTLRREVGEAKAKSKELHEFIRYLIHLKRPVVMFAWHTNVLETFKKTFKDLKPSYLTGGITPRKKYYEIDRFQAGESDLFIGQLKAGGVGVDLPRASEVMIFEPDWLPALVEQAIGRIKRPQQKNKMTAWFPLSPVNPIDKAITKSFIEKLKNIKKILD